MMFPVGGSAEELERELASLQSQVRSRQATLDTTRKHALAVEKGRSEGDRFLSEYFLEKRTALSTLLNELNSAAAEAKVTPRESSYSTEPVEGSDTLSMMTITGAYEGSYGNLIRFVHELDRSPRLLIIESLNATPQQNSDRVIVSMRLDVFVREDGAQ